MGLRCGIDLGTTYSAISWYDEFNTRVDTIDLESADGQRIIRSVVFYPAPGHPPVIGEPAWNAKKTDPDRVIVGIKRSMGTDFMTPPIDGVQYSPQQVSAEILKTLVKDAGTHLGESIDGVVITVPAYFGDNERAATLEAGQQAGLNVLCLLPEPHAAALAFAVDKLQELMDRAVLVYDLGGGTFDVTLIRAKAAPNADSQINLNIDTLCKNGNAHLGGLDWDRNLGEIVAEKVMQEHGTDVWQDPKNEAVLLDNCEKGKRSLTTAPSTSIVADLAGHSATVSRDEFEDRTRALLMQSQALLEQVLADAERDHGLTKDKVDILLAGGSSRMPMVAKMVESVLGRPPLRHKNPELLVTVGAAYWAHLLKSGQTIPVPVQTVSGQKETKQVKVGGLTDVTMDPIGVEVFRSDGQGGYKSCNAVVVPGGARYNEVFSKEFATSEDGMTAIPIVLYKGDSDSVDQCERLMEVTISGLPGGRPRGQRVKVSLKFDDSGILTGEALDVTSKTKVDIIFDRSKN
jgi:molecular chaperone DnaK